MRMPRYILALIVLLAATICSQAQTYTITNSGNWSNITNWLGRTNPAAGGGASIIIKFSPTATIISTNDLAGDFYLNQLQEAGSFNVTNWCPLGNALVFTNNGSTAPLMTNQNNFTIAMNQRLVLQSNFTFGPFSGGTLVINSNITENINSVRLSKTSGTVTINNTNNITGGLYLTGAGTLSVTNDFSLGATNSPVVVTATSTLGLAYTAAQAFNSQRILTISNAATLTVTAGAGEKTWNGKLSGSGTLTLGSASMGLTFTNSANDFTGTLNSPVNSSGTSGIGMASCDDSTTNGIVLGGGVNPGSFRWYGFSGSPKTFSNRQFYLAGTTGGGWIVANGSSVGDSITVLKDLAVIGTGTKAINFGGSNAGTNVFAGAITNGPSGSILTVNDSGTAVWNISGNISVSGGVNVNTAAGRLILSGTNSYSGVTVFAANNTTLTLQNASKSMSTNTSFLMNNNSSSDGSTLNILDDNSFSATNVYLHLSDNNSSINAHVVFVGNNNVTNGGNNASSSATGNTITIGFLTFTNGMLAGTYMGNLNVTGSNGYTFGIQNVILANLNTAAVGTNAYLNPTTASMTLGNVTQVSGQTTNRTPTLNLDGTSGSNYVTGVISDASDALTTGKPLKVLKSNTSTWILSGTNTYTGGTLITGGKLVLTNSMSLGGGGVVIGSGAKLALGFIGTETTSSLTLNGVAQPNGIYNATTSPTYIEGTGNLQVGTTRRNGFFQIITQTTM